MSEAEVFAFGNKYNDAGSELLTSFDSLACL